MDHGINTEQQRAALKQASNHVADAVAIRESGTDEGRDIEGTPGRNREGVLIGELPEQPAILDAKGAWRADLSQWNDDRIRRTVESDEQSRQQSKYFPLLHDRLSFRAKYNGYCNIRCPRNARNE